MKTSASKLLALAALVGGLGMMSSAQATWTFTSANTASKASGDAALTTIGGAAIDNAGGTGNTGGFQSATTTWTTQALTFNTPGLGNCSDGCSAPNHAIDNLGNTEAVLLGFASSVVLSNINMSYTSDGSATGGQVDVSIFRWIGGTGAPVPGATMMSGASQAMTGWQLVGNYGDVIKGGTGTAINGSGLGSSWWLISAYNSAFTGALEARGSLDNGNDYFKLNALTGTSCTGSLVVCGSTTTSVPEPTSLALVGLALLGLVGGKRRRS